MSRKSVGLALVGTAAALCCGGGIIAAAVGHDGGQGPTVHTVDSTYTGRQSAVPAPTAKQTRPPASITEGTWEIGAEVKPGTYKTTATAHCYWARLSSFDTSDIIDNGNLNPGAHGVLSIKNTDKAVQLSGPCEWVRAG